MHLHYSLKERKENYTFTAGMLDISFKYEECGQDSYLETTVLCPYGRTTRSEHFCCNTGTYFYIKDTAAQ
jgi:hypothetical protein